MNVWVRKFAITAVLAGLAAPALAESLAKKYERLYGMGSSTTKHTACKADPLHTMSSYIKSSVMDKLHKKPELYGDRATIDLQRIPGDIDFRKAGGVYINNKETFVYVLPEIQPEYESIGIRCKYGVCGWVIKPVCIAKTLSGQEMLVYWSGANELQYVSKNDFSLVSDDK